MSGYKIEPDHPIYEDNSPQRFWAAREADKLWCSDSTGPDDDMILRYWSLYSDSYPGDQKVTSLMALEDYVPWDSKDVVTQPVIEHEHILYRMFDSKFRLLYAGITLNVYKRMNKHATEKHWWDDVTHITLERYESRAELAAAERRVIVSERPKFNIHHNNSTNL